MDTMTRPKPKTDPAQRNDRSNVPIESLAHQSHDVSSVNPAQETMQTHNTPTTTKRGGARPGAGRPSNAAKEGRTRTQFAEWVERSGKSKEDVRVALRLSKASLYALLSGESRPSLDTAFDIEELTEGEIPARSWWVSRL